jgi:Zn finger protein HypA/HybF involved in hydrogenase expression
VHELGIAQGILDRAREAAGAHGAVRVTDLSITITAAADFTQDSLEMYLEMLTSDDELFRGVGLHFVHEPVVAVCMSCGQQFSARSRRDACPACECAVLRFDAQAPTVQLTDISVDEECE